MAITANPNSPTFWAACYANPPTRHNASQNIDKEWHYISLQRRKSGRLFPQEFLIEKSTGDLYAKDDPISVAQKCVGILIGAPLYMATVLVATAIRSALQVVVISSRVFSNIINKGYIAGVISTIWDAITVIVFDLSRCVKAPFYTVAIMIAALWGIIQPYEGRKKIAELEYEWHEKKIIQNGYEKQHSTWKPAWMLQLCL